MLKMLHPFMPFITEEIWSYLPHGEEQADNPNNYLIKATWPKARAGCCFPAQEAKLEMAMEAIRAIRNIRAEADAAPSRKLRAIVLAEGEKAEIMKSGERYLKSIANITEVTFTENKADIPEEVMSAVIDGAEIYVPLDDLVDYKAELERLTKEKKKLEGEVERVVKKLSNPGFVGKAPEKVINEEKEKQVKYEEMLAKVSARLELVAKKVNA